MRKQTACMAVLVASIAGALAGATVGQPAPDFSGTDINGKTHKLSDYKGKVVVLEAYNLDCPFCLNHYKTGAMQELQKDLTAKGVVWLVVNSVSSKHPSYRTPEAAKQEWTAQKMKATAWLDDSSGEIGRKFGMRTTPHMLVIDDKGVLAYDGAIDDREATDGKPQQARNYVREAVQALLNGNKVAVAQTKPYGCSVKYGS